MTEHSMNSPLVRRTVATIAAGGVLVGALTACADPDAPAAAGNSAPTSSSAPATDSTLHTISNSSHKLAFHVMPGHLPAIVLDAGGGQDSSYWKNTVPALAKSTGSEIITYDRAGVGASDEVPGPWKVGDAVSDLEAGLRELGVTRHVVLVSHSLAGEIATYFVNKDPDWVDGAVLLDASLPEFYTDSELTKIEAVNQQQIDDLKKQPSTKQTRQLLAVAANYGPMHRAYHQMTWRQAIPATAVVSAKTPFDTSPDDAQLWRDAQVAFVAEAPNRRLVTAENSSHDIPIDRPDIVDSTVEDMVQKVS